MDKEDSFAVMGMGATNTLARVAASIGALSSVEPSFDSCVDGHMEEYC
jgi:hypothetical protein